MKIGLIYQGNATNEIWGCYITTFYLQKALKELGHEVWRFSITYDTIESKEVISGTDMIIVEGTPDWLIPENIWSCTECHIFWWLSDLYYNKSQIINSRFDGVATNSKTGFDYIHKFVPSAQIDLAVDKDFCNIKRNGIDNEQITYLGLYPHKNEEQMDFLFTPASKFGLSLWGRGWENSKYAQFAKGILPIDHIGQLYSQSKAALLITETRQMDRGMFNNRVFEILGSGCIALSESYSFMENSDLGKFINFFNSQDQIYEFLHYTNFDSQQMNRQRQEMREYLSHNHTYINRANDFIAFYEKCKPVENFQFTAQNTFHRRVPRSQYIVSELVWLPFRLAISDSNYKASIESIRSILFKLRKLITATSVSFKANTIINLNVDILINKDQIDDVVDILNSNHGIINEVVKISIGSLDVKRIKTEVVETNFNKYSINQLLFYDALSQAIISNLPPKKMSEDFKINMAFYLKLAALRHLDTSALEMLKKYLYKTRKSMKFKCSAEFIDKLIKNNGSHLISIKNEVFIGQGLPLRLKKWSDMALEKINSEGDLIHSYKQIVSQINSRLGIGPLEEAILINFITFAISE